MEGQGIGGSEIEADAGFLDGICQILAEMNEETQGPFPPRLEPWAWALSCAFFFIFFVGWKDEIAFAEKKLTQFTYVLD